MSHTFSHGDGDYLSDAQLAQILKGINPVRVNRDPKGMSYVEAYEIRAHLTRIFGPLRWDEVISDQRLVFEAATEGEKPRWTVCWYAHCTLTVRSTSGKVLATYGEGATGDAQNFPSRSDAHDMAVKTAASQALKRCAMNLGDQFGLSLYSKGSTRPLVQRTLIWEAPESEPAASPDAHITTPLAPESAPETGETQRETTSPPASKAPAVETYRESAAYLLTPGNGGEIGHSATYAADTVEPERPADPTVPDADGGSPAVSEDSASSPAEPCESCGSTDGLHEEFCYKVINEGAPERTPGATVDAIAAMHPAEAADPTAPSGTASASAATTSTPAATSAPAEPSREASASTGPAPASPETAGSVAPAVSPSVPQTPAEPTAADSTTPDRGPTPGSGSEPTAEDSGVEDAINAWERIVATVSVIRMSPPEEALQILNGLMETAAQFRLATRRYPDTDKALSIILTEHMRDARAAIERRRAAVQS